MGKPFQKGYPDGDDDDFRPVGSPDQALQREGHDAGERWGRILANGAFADLCDRAADVSDRNAWRDALGLGGLIPETFILEVDYTKLSGMICMPNDQLMASVTGAPSFKVMGSGLTRVEARLFDFGVDEIKKSEILGRIRQADKKRRWSPCRAEHLCAFSDAFPKTRIASLVFALCLSTQHNMGHYMSRYQPYVLMAEIPHRIVSCVEMPDDRGYGKQCSFLAVRPIRPAA